MINRSRVECLYVRNTKYNRGFEKIDFYFFRNKNYHSRKDVPTQRTTPHLWTFQKSHNIPEQPWTHPRIAKKLKRPRTYQNTTKQKSKNSNPFKFYFSKYVMRCLEMPDDNSPPRAWPLFQCGRHKLRTTRQMRTMANVVKRSYDDKLLMSCIWNDGFVLKSEKMLVKLQTNRRNFILNDRCRRPPIL